MRLQLLAAASYAALSSAHGIFQKVSINGQDQGSLGGLRAPNSNNPVQNTQDQGIICGAGSQPNSKVLSAKSGDKVGVWMQHVIGGPQGANDADNPIAKSHKGPITVYLAKVDNAASSPHTGQKWFKVYEDGFDGSKWAVDKLIEANGWFYWNIPSCIGSGDYLARIDLLALHGAGNAGGAQFYTSCAQLKISGSGSFTPSQTVSFPGAFGNDDPGVKVSIYGSGGQPNMGGKSYSIPGPRPITCGGSKRSTPMRFEKRQ